MIVEERIYTLHIGKVPEYLALYEAEGLAIQTRILGRMLGYYQVEFGPQNQLVHLWAYDDLADRATRRKALMQDPGWRAYVAKIRPLVRHQENKLLIPAAFSPQAPSPLGDAPAQEG
ncbi:MAG: NIPSNAP family protein [Pseudomonadota bacterium]